MTSLLVIIVLVLLAVAIWQLTKIFDLTQVGNSSADDSQIATDNDNNVQGYLMFGFLAFIYIFTIYGLIKWGDLPLHTPASEHGSDVDTVMNITWVLILINTDFKRISWVLVMAGVVILLGHYVDFFNMIMPGTVGDQWFIGVSEIASILFFLGLFIYVVFTTLAKAPLLAKRNPFIEESKHFHY